MTTSDLGDDEHNLGSRAARGAVVTAGGQAARMLLQVGAQITLAWLLLPQDFGLVAMAIVVVGLGEIMRDFGLSAAAIQTSRLTTKQRDNLFWLNSGIGLALGAVLALLAGPLSEVYGEPRLVKVLWVLSSIFLINGMTTQYSASLSRAMKFGRLVTVELLALAGAATLAVLGALAGWGYWALVSQQVAVAVLTLVFLVAFSRWIPKRWHSGQEMRRLIGFGTNLFAVQLITYFSKNVDTFIIGVRFGPTQLGYYDRSFQFSVQLLQQINTPATKVAFPVLARLQGDRYRHGQFLITAQTALLVVVLPMLGFAVAFADHLVPLVLGEKWVEIVPIFRILLLASAFQAVAYSTYWYFLSRGLMASNLKFTLLSRPIMIGLIVTGSFFGVQGVALGYLAGVVVQWIGGLLWIGLSDRAPALPLLTSGIQVLTIAVTAAVAAYVATSWLGLSAPLPILSVGLLVVLLFAAGGVALVPGIRAIILGVVSRIRRR